MNIQKPEGLLSAVVRPADLPANPRQLFLNQDQQDEEASDCPLLTPSPPPQPIDAEPSLENINTEDGLNAFMNIVNSSSKPLNDEPSSRDPMVESTTSGSSSDTNEPVCAQLLTQLNTAYQHLAPDAQALFYNQENGGKPPLVGIQLVVPKPPKDYRFMKWNWPLIRRTCFWSLMSVLAGCTALVIGVIATMPRKCDPSVEWWQGSVFYEIFPASFQDSSKGGDGIGDLRGVAMRLDYLKGLGVRGIRLNSIYPAAHYPEYYNNIESMTELEKNLGTLDDFGLLVREVHRRNMSLILDLPIYPFVKSLQAEGEARLRPNGTDNGVRERRDATDEPILRDVEPKPAANSMSALAKALALEQPLVQPPEPTPKPVTDLARHPVTSAIKAWLERGVDGFYLKGLEHYVEEEAFARSLRYWRSLLGHGRIFICHVGALEASARSSPARNAILARVDLVDVPLEISNGTRAIRDQVEAVTKGVLFERPGYPWVHWSIGGVDSRRVASTLRVKNATMAASLLGMMLPGTPSVFYGDEIGIPECECEDHKDLAHVHNLAPMYWEKKENSDNTFASVGVAAWLPEASKPLETSLIGAIAEMAALRAETTPIYVKAVMKESQIDVNCDIRYADNDLIVIERWYPRRNSYIFVANLGNETRTKDLSSLYYGGHVVVGPKDRLNRDVYFKELALAPGEALVVKLDK